MKKGQQRFFSLAYKNAAFYIVLILLSSLLIGYFIYRQSTRIIIESSEQNARHIVEILDVRLQSYLDNVKKDVLFISRSPYLKDYLQAIGTGSEESKRMNLTADYVSFLSSKPDYAQIRFIGTDHNGKEVIRVDRFNNNVMVISQDELQEKGGSGYFRETIVLPEDSASFSIIDLNKEHGRISQPVMPTLRVSCPIMVNRKVVGMAVINTNLNSLFKVLRESVSGDYELYIFNSLGQCMIHPDPQKAFAFEYGREHSFFTESGIDAGKLVTGINHLEKGDRHFYIKKIQYPRSGFDVYIGLDSNQNKLLAAFYDWRWSILGITLMVSSLIVLVALWWLRKQSRSMQDIVDSIIEFEKDLETGNLPVSRNDEIGIIARTFGNMSSTIKRSINNLAIAKKEAEQANMQKEEFLQNMSHEIRNPLHNILGMSRMLKDNEPRQDQLPVIESLRFSSQTLLALVNDILDFSKLKEGKISLTPRSANLEELLDNIIKSYSYEALTKRITIRRNFDPRLGEIHVVIDPLRFNQVMNNLLSNAIKFSPSGSEINADAVIISTSDAECIVRLAVRDQGPGIPEDKLDLVMQRFHQLEVQDHRDQIGTGLGLPIVVQILQLFRSELKVRQVQPQGSEFSFELSLPMVKDAAEPEAGNNNLQRTYSLLVIDDDPQISMLYRHVFSDQKISHRVIQHMDELQADQEKIYDVLITDNYLGQDSVLNHLSLLKKVTTERSPRILLTGDHNLVSLLTSSEGFFDCILQKPVQTDELLPLADRIIEWKKGPLPDLMSLYRDYDFDKEKISNALQLLIREWKNASGLLQKAMTDRNDADKNAIVHKLANSLRRFDLAGLESKWQFTDLSSDDTDLKEFAASLRHFGHCIEYIGYQQRIWNS